jgi:hypothetical protein
VTPVHDPELVTGSFDIGSGADQERVRRLADSILASAPGADDLLAEARRPGVQIDLALALKMARSRTLVRASDWEGHLAVVFAMWGEQRRLLPRSGDNPTGEDAMVAKLDQLDWLLDGTSVGWSLVAVDDGDPDDSATVARRQADGHRHGDRVTVLRLDDALPADDGPLADLASADDSRKGGAVVLGAHHAVGSGADAVVLTDADNSVHLGQVGLLLDPFARGEAGAAIGDRKHRDSVLLKAEARWGPGIVVLRHMQRMVGRALYATGLRDTQAAFKLYGRRALGSVLEAPSTFGFSFDADWLYATVAAGEPVARVPLAFIDSFEESASITQGPMTTWASLLTGLVAAARARGADHDEEMAAVIDDFVTADLLEEIIDQLPDALIGVADDDLGTPSVMSPGALRTWLEGFATR